MKHSQSQTCPDHFRMNAHCQSDYQLLFEHLEEDPNLPPVDPYEKIGKDVDIADLQHRLEILKNLIKEKNQLKEKAAANVGYMAQLRMLEQEIGLLTKASDKLGTIDTKDGKVNFFDFQGGFEKIKVRKANKYIEKAGQIEAQLVTLEKSLGIERPMTHRQMMATMKKMQGAVGDGDLNGSVSSVVNAVNGGTLDANTLQQLQQGATTSNGLMSNLSGSVKEYQNKGANRISEHTNATPQQAKTITKLATAGVLIAGFLYFWNDVKGWKNKALVAGGLYAILAMAFGNKKASDVIDGVLAGNGMLSRGTLTAPNTGQYGLDATHYPKMYEGKKSVEGLLSYMKDQNDSSTFLKEYITLEDGKRSFDAQKLVDTFENESTNEQVTKYLKEGNENTAKFMMILAAYKGRLAKQEHAKMNEEVNSYLQTIGITSEDDLKAKIIRNKDLEAYNAGQTKYEEEMKKTKEELGKTVSALGAFLKPDADTTQVATIVSSAEFEKTSPIGKLELLDSYIAYNPITVDISSPIYQVLATTYDGAENVADKINKTNFLEGFMQVKTFVDHLYPRDSFTLVSLNNNLYIQHGKYKLKVEPDGGVIYMRAKGGLEGTFQLGGSSDPKVAIYDAFILLTQLNSYVRKLDIPVNKDIKTDTEYPFYVDNNSLYVKSELAGTEHFIRLFDRNDCADVNYLVNHNTVGVKSSYYQNLGMKQLATELNTMRDGSSGSTKSIFQEGCDIPQEMQAIGVNTQGEAVESSGSNGGFETATEPGRYSGNGISRETIRQKIGYIGTEIKDGTVNVVKYLLGSDGLITAVVVDVAGTVGTLAKKGGEWVYETAKDAGSAVVDDLKAEINQPDTFADYINDKMKSLVAPGSTASEKEKKDALIKYTMGYKAFALHMIAWRGKVQEDISTLPAGTQLDSTHIVNSRQQIRKDNNNSQWDNILKSTLDAMPNDLKTLLGTGNKKDNLAKMFEEYMLYNYNNPNAFSTRLQDSATTGWREFKEQWEKWSEPNGPLGKFWATSGTVLNAGMEAVSALAKWVGANPGAAAALIWTK